MKKILRIAGITLWIIGIIWVIYITGAVFSHTEGFTSLAGMIGPLAFHLTCMFLGGFCFVTGTQKAAEEKSAPAPQA